MKTKYHRWYDWLIKQARGRKNNGYVERHHVKPRSLGGCDHQSNIVELTYREHFLVHWLLTKMHRGAAKRKMQYALLQMTRRGRAGQRIRTSWQYEIARRTIKDAQTGRTVSHSTRDKISKTRLLKKIKVGPEQLISLSKRMKGNTYRRGKPLSDLTKERMSFSRIGNTNTLGFKASKETKAKISKSLMGNKRSVGRVLTPEHVAAIRAGHERYWDARRGVS